MRVPSLRDGLLALSQDQRVRRVAERAPGSQQLLRRFVAGEDAADALDVVDRLAARGLRVSVDHLGEGAREESQAIAHADAAVNLLEIVGERAMGPVAEVSVKLSALGSGLPEGPRLALEQLRRICAAAEGAGTSVTVDMEEASTVDVTLHAVEAVRDEFPRTGVAVQAYLRRTEEDCVALADAGARVRVCKGAYAAEEDIAFASDDEIDRSYVRCLKALLRRERSYPMIATHDPRLVAVAEHLLGVAGRLPTSYEFQMLYGIRPKEQVRLAERHAVRVYVPYGTDWYGYFVRRVAEHPSHVTLLARALVGGR